MSLTQLLDAPEISDQRRKQQVKLSMQFVSRCQIQALHASVDRIAMCENERLELHMNIYMSHFSYACKTEGENGISCLISAVCVNCLSAIPEYSRFIDYSIIWMSIWCGLL